MGQKFAILHAREPRDEDLTNVQRGEARIQKAVEAEKEAKYYKALELYTEGISFFITACKNETLTYPTKDEVESWCEKYLAKCEELRPLVDEEEARLKEERNAKILSSYVVKPDGVVTFDDVIGMPELIKFLKESVIQPLKNPDSVIEIVIGDKKPKNLILIGSPGTGKTLSMHALRNQCEGLTMISAPSSDFISTFTEDSHKIMESMFEIAREKAPAIVFLDDLDLIIGPKHQTENVTKVKQELLAQLSKVFENNESIFFIAATQYPWELSEKVMKMFTTKIYTPVPDKQTREAILHRFVAKNQELSLSDKDIAELAESTEDFTGADCCILIREALMQPVRQIQQATHFKKTTVSAADGSSATTQVYTVCDPSDPDAEPVSFTDIPEGSLHYKPVTMAEVKTCLKNIHPSVSWREAERFKPYLT